jgi:hypothetical protein
MGSYQTPQIDCGYRDPRDDSPKDYELLGWCHCSTRLNTLTDTHEQKYDEN